MRRGYGTNICPSTAPEGSEVPFRNHPAHLPLQGDAKMAKILVIAKCKDQAQWETGFRSHADFFRTAYGVSKPVSYGMAEDNYVGTCFEVDDLARFMSAIGSPETAEAMEGDGLYRETVKVFVLDKELAV
jgi:hypothetical protein